MWIKPNWGERFRTVWHCVRGHPIKLASVALLLAMFVVPVWPYEPYCGNPGIPGDFRTLAGEMVPDFVEVMDRGLWEEKLIHLRLGNQLYVPLTAHLLPFGGLTFEGGAAGAQLHATHRLVTPYYIGSFIGKELRGRIYEPPAYFKALLNEAGWPDADDCTFVRAVAFGERPPPGYIPENAPFGQSPD